MTSHWKAVLGILLIFGFGCISGWIGASVVHYREVTEFLKGGPEAVAHLLEKRMTRNLHLDDNQKQQIHGYFVQNLEQRKLLQSQIQPQIQALNHQTLEQINAILRPEQREILHQNLALFKKRTGKNAFNPNAEASPPSEEAAPNTIGTTNPGAGTPPPQ